MSECVCVCARVVYLVLIGEPPDPSGHFRRKDEEQEEEELNGTNNDVKLQNTLQYFGSHTRTVHSCHSPVPACMATPSWPRSSQGSPPPS